MFTDRELATATIVLGVVAIMVIRNDRVRTSALRVVEAFLDEKVLIPFTLFAAYIAGVVWTAAWLGLWERNLLGPTIIWFIVGGLPLFISISIALNDSAFWKGTIRGVFEVAVIVEFVVNLADFGFVRELILQPLLILAGMMYVISGTQAKWRKVRKVLGHILAYAAFISILFALRNVYQQRSEISFEELILSFILVIWLSLAAVPFVFALTLYAAYEQAFIRMGVGSPHFALDLRTRLAIVIGLNVRLYTVTRLNRLTSHQILESAGFLETLVNAWQFHRSTTTRGD